MSGLILESAAPVDDARLGEMFKLRHGVFKERLGWDVQSRDGREFDEFDTADAVYGVVYDDDHGDIEGCFRLLPTTGLYMLGDVWPELLHGRPAPRDQQVLESSRFAVLPSAWHYNSKLALLKVTAELLALQLSYCLDNGICSVVSVTDVRFERVLRAAGLVCERFGPPLPIGNTRAVAGWLEATEENLAGVNATHAKLVERQLLVRTSVAAGTAGSAERPIL